MKTRRLEQCGRPLRRYAAMEVADRITNAGGVILGSYKEPLGAHPVLFAILPIDAVEPTPFQRDLSA